MKRSLLAFAAACLAAPLVSGATPAFAQDNFPPAPPIAPPKPFKLPATETFTLPNGLEVTLVPYGVAPKTVVSLRVFAGSLNEGEDTWLADVTGEMMKEGAGGRSAQAMATAAAGMGGDLNVAVGPQQTTIAMNVLSEHAGDAIALVADVARRPDLPAGELARVKANLGRRLAVGLSQPGLIANTAMARAYYGTAHPYGRLIPGQTQLSAYTIEQIRAFHADNFGAKRARLYVAGKFDAATVKAAIEKAFGGWAAGPERLALPVTPRAGPQVILVDRPGAPQATVRLIFPAPLAGSEGDIGMRVANALLGGAFSSRITRNIREDKGYTYSPNSGIQFYPDVATWTFNADLATPVTGAALREVFNEIKTLQTTTPPTGEAEGMRTYMAGLFVIQNSTAPALVNTLANREVLGLPDTWLEGYVPAVMAVTPAQMSGAIKSALPLDKLTLVVVGDLATVEPQLKALPELANLPFQRVTVP